MSKRRATHDLSTRWGRFWAWLHFYIKDHHVLRLRWWNLHQIAPGVWRSNQPSPRRLARYAGMGIVSVVSLRGQQAQSFNLFEAEACAAHGLGFRHVSGLTARSLFSGAQMVDAIDQIARMPRPLVFHCKSGADRTGLVAALFLILIEDRSVAEAAQQLARKHIHFKRSRAGVLDHLFRVYLRDVSPTGQGFRDWLLSGYDPAMVQADFNDWRAGVGRWAQ